MTSRRGGGRRRTGQALVAAALSWWLLAGTAAPAVARQPPRLSAGGAVLWDPADGRALHGVAGRRPRPMASTTKIMTVLLALEAGAADETLTVSPQAEQVGRAPGAATLELHSGQQLPVASVLAGLVLQSGNDGAVAVAEHVAGSEAAFTEKMNARAAELGLEGTTFVNASGLTDDPDHAASPRDLARLGAHALRDDVFAGWARAVVLEVPGLGTLRTRNELLGSYPGADGIKTGYTALAGMCLVASATRDGRRLVSVVLGSRDSFGDSRALLDYGFRSFRRVRPVAAGTVVGRYRWQAASVPLVADEELSRTLRRQRAAVWRTVLEPAARLPVDEGQVLGRAQLVVGGRVVDETPLRAARPAPAARLPDAGPGPALADALRAFARLQPARRDV